MVNRIPVHCGVCGGSIDFLPGLRRCWIGNFIRFPNPNPVISEVNRFSLSDPGHMAAQAVLSVACSALYRPVGGAVVTLCALPDSQRILSGQWFVWIVARHAGHFGGPGEACRLDQADGLESDDVRVIRRNLVWFLLIGAAMTLTAPVDRLQLSGRLPEGVGDLARGFHMRLSSAMAALACDAGLE